MSDESNAFITTLSDRLIEYAGICGCAYGAGLMRQAAAQIGERDAARNMYSEICTLRTRISTLRKRLEIDRMTVYDIKGGEIVGQREVECEDDDFDTDGIACRDATIGLLEETRDTLRAELDAAKVDELVWPQWPHMSFDPNCKLCKGDGITYYQDTSSHNSCPCGKYDPPKYTARSRGETGEKIG